MLPRAELPDAHLPLPRGPVLVLAAHPGDELVGCGGTLALHVAQGDRVHVVIVYDGAGAARRGEEERESLAQRRRAECQAGGAHLGLEHYEFWDYPEGREPTPDELFFGARLLCGRIAELAPRTLYVPWAGELRHDQRVLAHGTRLALEMAERELDVFGCEVWTPLAPTRVVDISCVWEQKRAALREHRSLPGRRDLAHVALGLSAQRSAWLPAPALYAEAFAPFTAPAEQHGRVALQRPGHAA
jgi:LmbE family N-acetylglucosaminyl deacetylase